MHPYLHLFSLTLPSYGAMLALGFLAAVLTGLARTRRAGLDMLCAFCIMSGAFVFAMIGAALLFLLVTYSPRELIALARSGALKSGTQMGFVFYGGLMAAVPGALLGARMSGARLRDYVCAILPCAPLGHAIGRVGCLLGGCCYGVPTRLPIGIVYPEGAIAPSGVPLFPVQPLESLALLGICALLTAYCRKPRSAYRAVGLYLMSYAPCRFALEFLRGDEMRGRLGPLSTSQWISLALLTAGCALWLPGIRARSGYPRRA